MNFVINKYTSLCNKPSDINEHLPTLFKYAKECNSIFETGVRGVVSSWALLFGLLMNNNNEKKTFIMNDIENCDMDEIFKAAKELNIDIAFKLENNLLIDFKENENYDLTFIDTFHVYPQLIRELNKFSKVTNKYIIMHDTTVDEHYGEIVRSYGNNSKILNEKIYENSKITGFSPQDLCRGLRQAIEEFLRNNKEWKIKEVFTNNNGLTILEKLI